MTDDLINSEEQIENVTGRNRSITLEYLNSVVKDRGLEVIARAKDPNYCYVKFQCGHTKYSVISKLDTRTPFCEICREEDVIRLCENNNFNYLTKMRYGKGKSRFETRLVSCKCCGYFMFVLPTTLKTAAHCKNCLRLKYQERANELGYNLIGNTHNKRLVLECINCGGIATAQSQNMMRMRVRCPVCGKKKVSKSFVYLFKVMTNSGDYLKLGKANNPYVRHLSFNPLSDETKFEFITSIKFKTEQEAFDFERYLKRLVKSFNLDTEYSKTLISSGYSEMYDTSALDILLSEFEIKRKVKPGGSVPIQSR